MGRTGRVLSMLIACMLLGTVAASCSPAPVLGGGETLRVNTAEPAGTPAPSGDRVLLRVGTGDSGDGLLPHKQIIAAFEKANPDIRVQLEPVDSGDYYGYLLDESAAGNAPDLMQIGDDAVSMFVTRGALTDLTPLIRGSQPVNPSIYLPGVFQPGAYQGRQYLLPKDFSTLGVYYNKKLFDQYHVPYPVDGWTWDDFLNTARALTHETSGDVHNKTWGVQLPSTWTSGFEYWVAAAGGRLISDDGKSFEGYLDSPETVSAAQFYADLYNRYQVAPLPANLSVFGGGNDQFAAGRAAMMISGRWPQAEMKKNPKISLGVVGMPVGRKRANVLFWSGFGIASSSKHQEAAWRLLRFYTGEESARIWGQWGLPTISSVVADLKLTSDPIEGVWLFELSWLAPRAYVFTPFWGDTADPALTTALQKLLLDPQSNTADVMEAAAQQAQAALDKHR